MTARGIDFSLVTWNLLQGLQYKRGRNDVAARLRSLDADVFVLQEAWSYRQPVSTMAEELAETLGYELHQWVGDAPSRARDVCPFRIVILTRIPAERRPDVLFPPFRRLAQRALIQVELVPTNAAHGVTVGGVHLYGVHALKRNIGEWRAEWQALQRATQDLDIVAGDFNMWASVVKRRTGPLRPAVSGRTWPAHRPHSQIDHVLISDRLEVLSSEVMANHGSDHRPLRARLRVRE